MKPSLLDVAQAKKVLKVAVYVGVSALLDYLISQTTGSQFGMLTPLINVFLVSIKQIFTPTGK